jgi:hypothetical protein
MSGRTAKDLLKHALPAPVIDVSEHRSQAVGTQRRAWRRLPRAERPFIRIPLEYIGDVIPFNAPTRLWYLLLAESQEGWKEGEIAVTAAFARRVNVDSRHKNRCLRVLEEVGHIEVDWRDKAAPRVTVKRLPLWAPAKMSEMETKMSEMRTKMS